MKYIFLLLVLTFAACRQEPPPAKKNAVEVRQSDIDYFQKDSQADGAKVLAEKARFVQAALDAGLDEDPVVRAEVARVLVSRLRETQLFPKLKEAADAPISESRLREIYEEGRDRYISAEKRQVAVLWLNPGQDPQRAKTYTEKLESARNWHLKNEVPAPKGFDVLSIDHSEHAPSRFKGGVVGWFPQNGGSTAWEKAIVGIAYSLENVGDVSPVVENSEGIFLVRYMGLAPSKERSFESVRGEMERKERQRISAAIEADFENAILDSKGEAENQ